MKTVLGFDTWTNGSRIFCRLVEPLKRRGLQLKLVHIGSWGYDTNRPSQELIGDLPVYDVSFYGDASFREILERENPAAVIFLHTQALSHRAFNRYARQAGVPTLHLYHGLMSVQAIDTNFPDRYRVLAWTKMVFGRLGKLVTKTWPIYIRSLLETGADATDWFRFVSDVVKQGTGRNIKQASPDSKTDYCAVFTESDVDHAVATYGLGRERVCAVGNPDLERFGFRQDDLGKMQLADPSSLTTVLYIDHGGTAGGFTFTSEQGFVDFLLLTRRALQQQGLHLSVKLHPGVVKLTNVPKLAADAGIDLCSDAEYLPTLQKCRAVITGPSSASLVPALLGLPLLLAAYGPFEGQKYGKVLVSYPRARLLTDIGQAGALLASEIGQTDTDALHRWIDRNVGPLPAEMMPDRVAEVMTMLIRERKELQAVEEVL